MDKDQAIAQILNGSPDLQHRCAAQLGYDAGYRKAIEDAEKEAAYYAANSPTARSIRRAIRKLQIEP